MRPSENHDMRNVGMDIRCANPGISTLLTTRILLIYNVGLQDTDKNGSHLEEKKR